MPPLKVSQTFKSHALRHSDNRKILVLCGDQNWDMSRIVGSAQWLLPLGYLYSQCKDLHIYTWLPWLVQYSVLYSGVSLISDVDQLFHFWQSGPNSFSLKSNDSVRSGRCMAPWTKPCAIKFSAYIILSNIMALWVYVNCREDASFIPNAGKFLCGLCCKLLSSTTCRRQTPVKA